MGIVALLYGLHFRLSLADRAGIAVLGFIMTAVIALGATTFGIFISRTRNVESGAIHLLLAAEFALASCFASLPSVYLHFSPRQSGSNSANTTSAPALPPPTLSFPDLESGIPPSITPLPPLPLHLQAFYDVSAIEYDTSTIPGVYSSSLRPRSVATAGGSSMDLDTPMDWDLLRLHLGVLPDDIPEVLSSFGSSSNVAASVSGGSVSAGSMSGLRRDGGVELEGWGLVGNPIGAGDGIVEIGSMGQGAPGSAGSAPRKVMVVESSTRAEGP